MDVDNKKDFFYLFDIEYFKSIEKILIEKGIKDSDVKKIQTKILDKVISQMTVELYNEIIKDAPKVLKKRRNYEKGFNNRLYKLWENPLDLSEAYLALSLSIGDKYNEQFRSTAAEKKYFMFDVLTRLHAQACKIGGEILTLLKNGYADGANARWRSLHEVVVIAIFISENGNEVAERYLQHDTIETYKAANEYQTHCKKINYPPYDDKEIEYLKQQYDELILQYGSTFKNTYGWAADALNMRNPNFTHLEKAVNLRHLRPFYRMASHSVHANPKSILFSLGLLNGPHELLLSGPSNSGLADPGQGMVISLNQINATLLSTISSITSIVTMNCLNKLVEKTCNEYIIVHRSLESPMPDAS